MFIFLLVVVYTGLMIVAVVLAIKEEFLVECPKGGAK